MATVSAKVIAVSAVVTLGALSAMAKTTTWTGGSGNWSTGTWSDGRPETGDSVIFAPTEAGAEIVNDLGAMTLESIKYRGTLGYSFTSADALTLTSATPVVFDDNGVFTNAANLVIGSGDISITLGSGNRTIVFTGSIAGEGNLKYVGGGSTTVFLELRGANSYLGDTTWRMCTVRAYHPDAFGTNYSMVSCVGGSGSLSLMAEGTMRCGYRATAGITLSFNRSCEMTGDIVIPDAATNVFSFADQVAVKLSGMITGGAMSITGYSSASVEISGDNDFLGIIDNNVGLVGKHCHAFGGFLECITGGSGEIVFDAAGDWPCDYIARPGSVTRILQNCTMSGDMTWPAMTNPYQVYFDADNLKNTVTFNGRMHGGGVYFRGYSANGVVINGDNDHAGTKIHMMAATLGHTNAVGAVGSTLTYAGNGSGSLTFKVGGVYPINFYFDNSNNQLMFSQTTYITGDIVNTAAGTHIMRVENGKEVHFYGAYTKTGGYLYPCCVGSDTSCGEMHFHGKLETSFWNGSPWSQINGWTYLYDSSNDLATIMPGYSTNIRCMDVEVLGGATVDFNRDVGTNCGRMDLNGFDQTVGGIVDDGNAPGTSRYFTTPDGQPAQLTLRATASATSKARFDGPLTLVYDPTQDCRQTFIDRVNAMTGELVVQGGTLALADGASFAEVSGLTVAANAAFEQADTAAVGSLAGVKTVELATSASLSLAETLTIDALYLNGQRQEPGTYTPDGAAGTVPLAPLKAGALVVVESPWDTKDANWQVGGANTDLTDASNWEDGAQDFVHGGLRGYFNVGEGATVNAAAVMKGLVFGGAAGAFALSGAETLTVRELGLTVGAGKTVTLTAPLELGSDQEWNVAEGGVLRVAGALTAKTGSERLLKTGLGPLYLDCESGELGPFQAGTSRTDPSGPIVVNVASNAFGTASDDYGVYIYGKTANPGQGQLSIAQTTVIERPVTIDASNDYYDFVVQSSRTARFTKLFRHLGSMRCQTGTDSRIVCEGGYYIDDWMCFNGPGRWIFRTEPITVKYFYFSGGTTVDIEVSGNTLQGLDFSGPSTLNVKVPYAVDMKSQRVYFATANGVFCVSGDQEIGQFMKLTAGEITSTQPSTIYFNQVTGKSGGSSDLCKPITNGAVRVTGSVVLYKHGDLEYAQNCEATTTGGFGVDEGSLKLLALARVPNALRFFAEGTGRLELDAAVTLNRKATLTVDSTAKVVLGSDQTIRLLNLNGQPAEPGVYTPDGANGTIAASWLEGGSLTVTGISGMVLLVK